MAKKIDLDNKALQLVVDRMELFEAYLDESGEKEKRKERWRVYRGQLDKQNEEYKEDADVPYTTATINTIVPRMVENDTKIRYVGETEKDDKNSKTASELTNDQLRKDELELTKHDGYLETLVQGTAFYKVYQDKKTLTADYDSPLLTIAGKELGKVRKTIKKILKDQPVVEHINLDDAYFDPYGWSINGKNECSWFGHRKLVTNTDLVAKYGEDILENIKDAKQSKANTDDRASETITGVKLQKDKHKNDHELFEYWENDRKIVVIDRCYVAEDGNNPFDHKKKPFLYTVDHRIPHQLLGMGEIDFLYGLQKILTNMIRSVVDKQFMAEKNLLFLEKNSGLNKDKFNRQPFGIHTVDDLQKIKFERLDGADPMTIQLIEMLKQFMELVSGISDYTKGTNDSSMNDTATGIQLIQDAANFVFKVKTKLANKMFLEQLGDFFIELNQQYLTRTWTVRVKDESGAEVYKPITKKDIKGKFITLVDEQPPLNDMVRRNEALQLYRQFQGDPDVNQRELKKEVLEAFGKDAARLMPGISEIDLQTNQMVTAEESEAEKEDELMFNGKEVMVSPEDDHEVHIIVHEEAQTQADNDTFLLIDNHIQIHKAFLSPRLGQFVQSALDNDIEQPTPEMMVGGMNEQTTGEIPGSTTGTETIGAGEGFEGALGATGEENQGNGGIL